MHWRKSCRRFRYSRAAIGAGVAAGIALFLWVGSGVGWVVGSAAQQPPSQFPPQFPVSGIDDRPSRYPNRSVPFEDSEVNGPASKRIRALNVERHKEMLSDASRLAKLAEELNQEIIASDSSTMTADQLRKVGEIAKLAKSVKDKMSYSVGIVPESPAPGRY